MVEQLGWRVMNGFTGVEKDKGRTRRRRMMYRARKTRLQSICVPLEVLDGFYAFINRAREKGAEILWNIILRLGSF